MNRISARPSLRFLAWATPRQSSFARHRSRVLNCWIFGPAKASCTSSCPPGSCRKFMTPEIIHSSDFVSDAVSLIEREADIAIFERGEFHIGLSGGEHTAPG